MSPAAPPLEDENLLSEILLRLPPQPSSLPRACAVCKRWRSLASDPAFSRRFRRHHCRNPPLLGFFHRGTHSPGQQHHLAIPPGFDPTKAMVNGAVLRSAASAGDVQHFKVVLVVEDNKGKLNTRRILACVYSSETRMWGNLISTPNPSQTTRISMQPAVLVGDCLYWLLNCSSLNYLEFNLVSESVAMIWVPSGFTVMRAEGGVLGSLSLSGFTAQLWKRNTNSDGVASWGTGRTIELDKLLSLDSDDYLTIDGFAEDNNLLFLWTTASLFTLQLESLQFKELPNPEIQYLFHPFESVYAAGI